MKRMEKGSKNSKTRYKSPIILTKIFFQITSNQETERKREKAYPSVIQIYKTNLPGCF